MGNPGGQIAGDCRKVVCNGMGGTTTVPDDTDLQDDGNPCTTDSCSGGVPQHLPAGNGTSCGGGLTCNGTMCGSGCIIGGTSYAAGAVNPASPCQVCTPATSSTAWSNIANGTFCTGVYPFPPMPTYPGICLNGNCADACWVNGQAYPSQQYFLDSQICLSCTPSTSRTSLYVGGCHVGTAYSAQINGTCGGEGICHLWTPDCQCSDCSVQPCGSGGHCTGLPRPPTTACTDDGNPCTVDYCNGSGGCPHLQAAQGTSCGSGLICHGSPNQCSAGCFIGGAFYVPGAASPGDPCQLCDPATSTSAWTSAPQPCP
jgi:hypothetical protein